MPASIWFNLVGIYIWIAQGCPNSRASQAFILQNQASNSLNNNRTKGSRRRVRVMVKTIPMTRTRLRDKGATNLVNQTMLWATTTNISRKTTLIAPFVGFMNIISIIIDLWEKKISPKVS